MIKQKDFTRTTVKEQMKQVAIEMGLTEDEAEREVEDAMGREEIMSEQRMERRIFEIERRNEKREEEERCACVVDHGKIRTPSELRIAEADCECECHDQEKLIDRADLLRDEYKEDPFGK